jgi:hypothetical protein
VLPPSTTDFEAGNLVAQADYCCTPTDIHNEKDNASCTSRSDFMKPVLATEYNKRLFQGFFKRTTVGDNIAYSLSDFKLLYISK